MNLYNTKTSYGSIHKFFHWFIFLLVIGMLCIGPFMEGIGNKALRIEVFTAHKSIGLTILTLMLLRIIWVLTNKKPQPAPGIKRWEKIAAHSVHGLLYIFIIGMTLTGWGMSTAANKLPAFFWLYPIPALPGVPVDKALAKLLSSTHTYLAIGSAVLIVVHIIAALKHHYVYKNDTLRRML